MKELLLKIEKNDRRFRIAQASFMWMTGIILIGVLWFQYQLLTEIRLAQVKNTATNGQTNALIQCLATFFAQTGRQEKSIADVNECAIDKNGDTIPGVKASDAPANTPPQDSGSQTKAAAKRSDNSSSTQEPRNPARANPPAAQPQPQGPQPAVVDLPVLGPVVLCTPLVRLCLEQ